jgi:S1-C subfamily serine protease
VHTLPSSTGHLRRFLRDDWVLARPAPAAMSFLLLLFVCFPPLRAQGQGSTSTNGVRREMSGEEIFRRFAGRILLLTCDLSANEEAQASGVLVSADGFIVTNAHVVEGCRTLIATHISGSTRRPYLAGLKYYDRKTDTAVLKITAQGLDHFELGPSVEYQQLRIGARVYAIGNPLGLEQTMSDGIVSGQRECYGFPCIQHTAAISQGSSGGALISAQGDLLGINYFLLAGSQNLNFAVPAATLVSAMSSARALGARLLMFPAGPVTAPPSAVASPIPPADAAGAFAKRDYLKAIQLAQQNVAAGMDSGRNYALIGSSYCELGKTVDAEPYITQTFVLLRNDDAYVQTAILCRLVILAEKFDHGETHVRSELAQTATRFLASSQPVLPGWQNADPRRAISTILSSLQALSGDWVDESGTVNNPRYAVFCRSSSCTKTFVRIADRGDERSYLASSDTETQTKGANESTHAYVVLDPKGDQYVGQDFSIVSRIDTSYLFVGITQRGVINLRLSPDTTMLTGEIKFDPATVNSRDFEPCQGCPTAAQWGDVYSDGFHAGTFQVRLVRK